MTTANLSPRALSIITRHEVQDAERAQTARTRTNRLRAIKEQERDIQRRAALFTAQKEYEANNPENVETAKAHGRRATAKEQAKAFLSEEQSKLDLLFAERVRVEAESAQPVLTATRIRAELERLGEGLVEIDPPEPALAKGERSLMEALPRFRDSVAILKARRQESEKSPLPAAYLKKKMRDQVALVASRGVPQVGQMFHGGEIGWPRLAPVAGVGAHLSQPIDAAALVTFLHRDLLIEKLDEIIDVNASAFPNPLTPRERQAAIARLDEELDAAERVEAACVEALVSQGHRVFHRPDISVAAVLSYRADISF